jgi:hypothetical protein
MRYVDVLHPHDARWTPASRIGRWAVRLASAARVAATPWAPAPIETVRPTTRSSATTGSGARVPNGVIVPRS